MKTTMENYNLKLRLFKCDKENGVRDFKVLNEVEYAHKNFRGKSKIFESYLNTVIDLIELPVIDIRWIKGNTWHDDMLFIEVEKNENDTYYKVAHFSS